MSIFRKVSRFLIGRFYTNTWIRQLYENTSISCQRRIVFLLCNMKSSGIIITRLSCSLIINIVPRKQFRWNTNGMVRGVSPYQKLNINFPHCGDEWMIFPSYSSTLLWQIYWRCLRQKGIIPTLKFNGSKNITFGKTVLINPISFKNPI